jgi:hypothetical protein
LTGRESLDWLEILEDFPKREREREREREHGRGRQKKEAWKPSLLAARFSSDDRLCCAHFSSNGGRTILHMFYFFEKLKHWSHSPPSINVRL